MFLSSQNHYKNAKRISSLHWIFCSCLWLLIVCQFTLAGCIINAFNLGPETERCFVMPQESESKWRPELQALSCIISPLSVKVINPKSHRDFTPDIIQCQYVLACLFHSGRIMIKSAITWRVLLVCVINKPFLHHPKKVNEKTVLVKYSVCKCHSRTFISL